MIFLPSYLANFCASEPARASRRFPSTSPPMAAAFFANAGVRADAGEDGPCALPLLGLRLVAGGLRWHGLGVGLAGGVGGGGWLWLVRWRLARCRLALGRFAGGLPAPGEGGIYYQAIRSIYRGRIKPRRSARTGPGSPCGELLRRRFPHERARAQGRRRSLRRSPWHRPRLPPTVAGGGVVSRPGIGCGAVLCGVDWVFYRNFYRKFFQKKALAKMPGLFRPIRFRLSCTYASVRIRTGAGKNFYIFLLSLASLG